MPTFERSVMSAPLGFVSGCTSVNNSANDDIATFQIMVNDIFQSVKGQSTTTTTINVEDTVRRTIEYIARSCAIATPKPEVDLVRETLRSSSLLSEAAIEAIAVAWSTEFDRNDASILTSSQMGQLFDLKWRLGVAVSSSTCNSLMSPYIALSFKIKNTNGDVKCQTMELTYSEFQTFVATFREVAAVMDTL